MRKKNLLLLCFFVLMVVFERPVYAAIDYEEGTCYHFNKTTGAYASSGGRDCVKRFDDKYVYCVQWKNAFGTGSKYEVVSSWKKNSATAIKAGLIIDLIYDNEKDLSAVKKYALTAATLNTYNSKLSSTWQPSKSYDFYSNNAVKKYYDKAMDYYDKYVKLSTTLNTPTFNVSNTLLDYSSNYSFFSNKVTLSGLLANYGNASDKVTYNLTASVSGADANDKAYICTGAGGTGTCKESVTISGSANDYSFYVKATGVEANDVIAIKVDGSNSSSYPTSIRYKYSNSTQKVLQKSSVSVSRSTTKSINFVVPDLTRHSISALKVDENGARLSGATLELYRDNVNSSNLLASSTNGQISYVSPTMAEDDDDFFNHSYYLVEKKALDGYVLNTTVKDIYKAGTDINKNTDICYYTDENGVTSVASDAKYCNFSDYEYRCLSSNGELKDLSENGNCNFEATSDDQGSETATTDENTNADTDIDNGENDSNDDGNTTPSEPEIIYEQICYSVSGAVQVDDSYCSDKDKYTNVKKIGGNITITQPNVKNNIKISKRAMTGEKEIFGASLKICTSADYESNKEQCSPTKTIDDVEMSWTSGTTSTEFFGIKKGSYYVVEVTPPSGYIVTTIATPFSIDEYGVVKSGTKEVKDNLIVVNNQLNHLSISKQDVATSKELPGAKISICYSYEDEDGNIKMVTDQYNNECIPVTLADGTEATWESTDKEHIVRGLPAGTYYLVEKIAPKGYSTAESILFTMKDDGTLTDKDGKSLADNKLIMYDKKLEEVKTGMFSLYVVGGIFVVVSGIGFGTYYYMGKKNPIVKSSKIRKRKIHNSSF